MMICIAIIGFMCSFVMLYDSITASDMRGLRIDAIIGWVALAVINFMNLIYYLK